MGFKTLWMRISVLLWWLWKPLLHSDKLNCMLSLRTAFFFTFSWLYSIKEHGHTGRADCWNDNHRRGLRRRREASHISWRHLCVCVCCCGFPAAAAFTPLMSPENVAPQTPTRLCVSLCAKACLDLNNNGGSDSLLRNPAPPKLHPRPSDAASRSTAGRR